MIKQSKKTFLLLCSFLVVCQQVLLAQASFTATISPGTIGKNENAELRLMVDNAQQVEQIIPPSLKDFIILSGPNQESGMESNNGLTRQYIGITFILKPRKTGKFYIEPAGAKADGKTLRSNKVSLVVNNSTGNGQQGNSAPGGLSGFYEPVMPSVYKDYILKKNRKKITLSLLDAPHFSDYEKRFNEGYNELVEGNCYQFNLTGEFKYSFDEELSAEDFISALWDKKSNRGAYASATYIEGLDKLFLSNSPECLFEFSSETLTARPIKGTLKRKGNIKDQWSELISDEKSQAELYMITDLLRNDLSRIDLPRAEVMQKKAMLLVPGLLHQYSEIKVKLRSHVTLKSILEKIFPGGSITGAPKKKTMQILKRLESRTRGFYCGSTVVFSKGLIEASINIRSSVIDFNECTLDYQAGGGITLLSNAKMEFEEMTYKHDSYVDILTL